MSIFILRGRKLPCLSHASPVVRHGIQSYGYATWVEIRRYILKIFLQLGQRRNWFAPNQPTVPPPTMSSTPANIPPMAAPAAAAAARVTKLSVLLLSKECSHFGQIIWAIILIGLLCRNENDDILIALASGQAETTRSCQRSGAAHLRPKASSGFRPLCNKRLSLQRSVCR